MTWRIKDSLPKKRLVYYGKVIAGRPGFIARDLLGAFLRLRIAPGGYVKLYQRGMLSQCAKLVMDALTRKGAAETRVLKLSSGYAQPKARAAFDRAMKELQEKFLALKVDELDDPFSYVWDTLEHQVARRAARGAQALAARGRLPDRAVSSGGGRLRERTQHRANPRHRAGAGGRCPAQARARKSSRARDPNQGLSRRADDPPRVRVIDKRLVRKAWTGCTNRFAEILRLRLRMTPMRRGSYVIPARGCRARNPVSAVRLYATRGRCMDASGFLPAVEMTDGEAVDEYVGAAHDCRGLSQAVNRHFDRREKSRRACCCPLTCSGLSMGFLARQPRAGMTRAGSHHCHAHL